MNSEISNRRLSTAITLTVLSLILVVGAYLGLKALFAPLPERADVATSPDCTPQAVDAGKTIATKDVMVSVFNASNRDGLATTTLQRLVDRGFREGNAGNAPDDADVRVVQVWTTEEDDQAAVLVARQFGRKVKVEQHDDLGPGIDVVVGPGFRSLAPNAPRSIRTEATEEVCVPEQS